MILRCTVLTINSQYSYVIIFQRLCRRYLLLGSSTFVVFLHRWALVQLPLTLTLLRDLDQSLSKSFLKYLYVVVQFFSGFSALPSNFFIKDKASASTSDFIFWFFAFSSTCMPSESVALYEQLIGYFLLLISYMLF